MKHAPPRNEDAHDQTFRSPDRRCPRPKTDAKRFLALLGFSEAMSIVISGPTMAAYMGVADIVADHVTLLAEGVTPRTEIQLLHYRQAAAIADPHIRDLNKIGLNHVCFAVDDIKSVVSTMRDNGYQTRNDIMQFHSR